MPGGNKKVTSLLPPGIKVLAKILDTSLSYKTDLLYHNKTSHLLWTGLLRFLMSSKFIITLRKATNLVEVSKQ